eukprot:TRINITY_DN98004_c0_g1_i1.p1 TRINITY_DN98004_c0_g1~~TRINITY_DN98004_c0_g1_i1.p1  ORF type:complete len:819 (-),score=253.89 TRINITY_DN98004_c0_g1_i1:67-2523(-)
MLRDMFVSARTDLLHRSPSSGASPPIRSVEREGFDTTLRSRAKKLGKPGGLESIGPEPQGQLVLAGGSSGSRSTPALSEGLESSPPARRALHLEFRELPSGSQVEPVSYQAVSSSRHCPQCGNHYLPDAVYCRKCGLERKQAKGAHKVESPVLNGSVLAAQGSRDTASTPRSERKALLAYVQCMQTQLEEVTRQNQSLSQQRGRDQARILQLQDLLDLQLVEQQLRPAHMDDEQQVLVAAVFGAWRWLASHAWCERWQSAEAALSALRHETASLAQSQEASVRHADEVQQQLLQTEATLEQERRLFKLEELQAREAYVESSVLQASSLQVGQNVQVLTEHLARTQALLEEERLRLRQSEEEVRQARLAATSEEIANDERRAALALQLSKTEALLAEERRKSSASELECQEALRQSAAMQVGEARESEKELDSQKLEEANAHIHELEKKVGVGLGAMQEMRQELRAHEAVRVEAERRAVAAKVEATQAGAALRSAESDGARAWKSERSASRAAEEACQRASELASRLRSLEEQAARGAEVDAAKAQAQAAEASAAGAAVEVNELREMLTRTKVFQALSPTREVEVIEESPVPPSSSCHSCGNRFLPDALYCRKCGRRREDLDSPPMRRRLFVEANKAELSITDQAEGSFAEMEQAVEELRRWRLEGSPPKLAGSALQKGLKARMEELEWQLMAARAIRARGLRQVGDGSQVAAVAAAAVAAARDACSADRIRALEEELADAQEVRAAAEGLMGELRCATAGFSSEGASTPEAARPEANALACPPAKRQVAAAAFTSELLEALASCRAELERARPPLNGA